MHIDLSSPAGRPYNGHFAIQAPLNFGIQTFSFEFYHLGMIHFWTVLWLLSGNTVGSYVADSVESTLWTCQ